MHLCAGHICRNLENTGAVLGMALKSAASVRGACQRGGHWQPRRTL